MVTLSFYVGRKGYKIDKINFLFYIKLYQKFLTKKDQTDYKSSQTIYFRKIACTRRKMTHWWKIV